MDDQDSITVDENKNPTTKENEAVPSPSRIRAAVDDVRGRIQDDPNRDIVQEYEERYHGRRRLETPAQEEQGAEDTSRKGPIYMPRAKSKRIYDPVSVSENRTDRICSSARMPFCRNALMSSARTGPKITLKPDRFLTS